MENEYQKYEYKTINVKKSVKYRMLDATKAFGYEIIETKDFLGTTVLSCKREEISHKDELAKSFDEVIKMINEIELLERTKKNRILIFTWIFGVIGLLTFGGGMSLVLKGNDTLPFRIGGISLGLLGIILMAINEPIYRSIYQKTVALGLRRIDELNNKINKALKDSNEMIIKSLE